MMVQPSNCPSHSQEIQWFPYFSMAASSSRYSRALNHIQKEGQHLAKQYDQGKAGTVGR